MGRSRLLPRSLRISLVPEESLKIVLEQPEESAFNLRLYAGEREVASFGGAPIGITVSTLGGVTQAVPQVGGAPIPVDKSGDGSAVLSISEIGTYSMEAPFQEENAERQGKKTQKWIWLPVILLFVALVIVFWLNLRKRRAGK